MSNENSKLYKLGKYMVLIPIVTMIATAAMWVDTRYMHKNISDTRFIELQVRIVESNIKAYNRLIDSGVILSAEDNMRYEMEKEQLRILINERNRVLRIGDLPN